MHIDTDILTDEFIKSFIILSISKFLRKKSFWIMYNIAVNRASPHMTPNSPHFQVSSVTQSEIQFWRFVFVIIDKFSFHSLRKIENSYCLREH